MSKQIFELFGLKKEPVHPIVARMELFKPYDATADKAYGVMITPLKEDGTNDETQQRLFLPIGQLREVLNGTFADGFVQQYAPYSEFKNQKEKAAPLVGKKR